MSTSQREVPALIKARKPFKAGEMSATRHYHTGGISYTPNKGWNTVMWPTTGALYIIYSFDTPIAWIDAYGRAKRSPQWYSQRTSRHQSLLYTLADDARITGLKADRERQDKIDAMRTADYHAAVAAERGARQRMAQQRRYWTPERIAAKELREQAKEVAALYGLKTADAKRALTQAPDEMSIEDAIASLTGTRAHA
jgi:hypothetical protein